MENIKFNTGSNLFPEASYPYRVLCFPSFA